jgi:N-acetylglucosaminyldiphosphoundecaprenol N-acetyl-beta-D-mannosaminyltransferase
MNLLKIIDEHVFSKDLNTINLNKKTIINTINPHSYCVSKSDSFFKKALLKSDILLPDGSGIVLAAKFLRNKSIKKIAGADIHKHLLEDADMHHKKVFYLGAGLDTLQLIKERISKEYPNIKMSSYSPPYKAEFSEADSQKMISEVNSFKPDVLFVGMTAPKQEKWVALNKDNLNVTIVVCIGAVFDFYAGTIERSSPFWINIGLEWLPRLLKEPKRLWRRNLVSTPLFLWHMLKAKLINN